MPLYVSHEILRPMWETKVLGTQPITHHTIQTWSQVTISCSGFRRNLCGEISFTAMTKLKNTTYESKSFCITVYMNNILDMSIIFKFFQTQCFRNWKITYQIILSAVSNDTLTQPRKPSFRTSFQQVWVIFPNICLPPFLL